MDPTSNLVADADWVYFAQAGKLSRISTEANATDPVTIQTFGSANPSGVIGLAQDADELFINLNASIRTSFIWRINKATGAFSKDEVSSGYTREFTTDGENLYWLAGTTLRAYALTNARDPLVTLDTGVDTYFAEGARRICVGCATTNYIFMAKDNQIYRRDNVTGTTTPNPIYTSSNERAQIFDLVSDGQRLFVWESRISICDPLCTYNAVLVLTNRSSDTTPELLYTFSTGISTAEIDTQVRNGYLYWRYGGIQRCR